MSKEAVTKAQDALRFTKNQLARAFGTSVPTITKKIGNVSPIAKRGNAFVWHMADVLELKDSRTPYIPPEPQQPPPPESDPDKMNPKDRIDHYKAEELRQTAISKQRKNAVDAGRLLDAEQTERVIAEAFKKVALTLDTLPDLLERDGIIGSADVPKIIAILDSSREQLAADFLDIAPVISAINQQGDW